MALLGLLHGNLRIRSINRSAKWEIRFVFLRRWIANRNALIVNIEFHFVLRLSVALSRAIDRAHLRDG